MTAIAEWLCWRRLFWQCVYPFARISHRWFGSSYKWVNVGAGAWNTDSFNELWQYQWYGTGVPELPVSVNLNGIRYETSSAEGLVQFLNRDFGLTRICFTRDPHDEHSMLWYLEASRIVPASHVETAYAWVKAVYGGSFEKK